MYYGSGGAFRVIDSQGDELYFSHGDHLGSVSVLSDSTGLKVDGSEVVYAPFGEVRDGTRSTLTDFGYTRQIHDDSTGGLMFYNARYYLPELRRFISADSVVPGVGDSQALNRFSYVSNNPMRFVDPSGHALCEDTECDEPITVQVQNIPGYNPPTDPEDGDSNHEEDEEEELTLAEKAWRGDPHAWLDIVFPTHGGWTIDMTLEFTVGPVELGGSAQAGLFYNFRTGQWAYVHHAGPEVGEGVHLPIGGEVSVTIGPALGWYSWDFDEMFDAVPVEGCGKVSAVVAVSGCISVPVDAEGTTGDPSILAFDSHSGTAPVTGNLRLGVGCCAGAITGSAGFFGGHETADSCNELIQEETPGFTYHGPFHERLHDFFSSDSDH